MAVSAPAQEQSARELVARDPAFGEVVRRVGPPAIGAGRPRLPHFAALARSICYQQLAGSAARVIHGRFAELFDGPPTPEAALALGPGPLRSVGLSTAKAVSVLDLAEKVVRGEVRLGRIGGRDDEAVVTELVKVRGIGRWTAEMFLIFQLRRPDVWPVGDYGVRKGWARVHGLAELPEPGRLQDLGESLRGLRSVAAWYCWRAVDPAVLGAVSLDGQGRP